MKSLTIPAVLAVALSTGCDAGPSEQEFRAVSDRVEATDERLESLEARLERLEELRERLDGQNELLIGLLSAHATGGSKSAAKPELRPMDPEHQRRLEALGIELLEKMAKSDAAGDALENVGALTNELLEQATRDLEETVK